MASVSRAAAAAAAHHRRRHQFKWSSPSRHSHPHDHGITLQTAHPLKIASRGNGGGVSKIAIITSSDPDHRADVVVSQRQRIGDGVVKNWSRSWEDEILSETVPLVGFVRMILHSGRYKSGDRLSDKHEKIIVEKLLPNHPKFEEKTGCGIDHIKVGDHPDFEGTQCLFIVKKDGELVDFSYWKCIHGLIKKKYPLLAHSFISRHFRRHWRRD